MDASRDRFNPYPGLRPFESDEDYLFFGREEQTDEVIRRLGKPRFLAVVGTSGSGKSSLVKAGLLPALYGGLMVQAGSSWRVALFRPGSDPIGELAQALNGSEVFGPKGNDESQKRLQTIITETTLRRSGLGLVEVVRQARMPEGDNLLVVVDQFEELFRFKAARGANGRLDSAAFVKLLLEGSRDRNVPIYVVITMRSDFLGDCAQFRDLPQAVNDGQFLVPRMTREQRRQAIEGPAAVRGVKMAPRLVQRLLNDVGDDPDQLPILQHALMRAWDKCFESGDEQPDLSHYEAIGGMNEALSRHADQVFKELSDDRTREVAEKLFKGVTEMGPDNRGIRRPTRLDELCEIVSATEEEVITVIDAFRQPGRSLLVPPVGKDLKDDSVVDISHESLMRVWRKLNGWVEEEAESARIYRRLAETAILHKKEETGFLHDPELQFALKWRDENHPNELWAKRYDPGFSLAMDFLEESRKEWDAELKRQEEGYQAELRRQRKRFLAITIGLILSIASGLLAFGLYRKAIRAETTARSRELAALSDMALEKDPSLSFRLAEASLKVAPTFFARRNLWAPLEYPLHNMLTGHQAVVWSAAFSPDGKRIVTASEDNTARVWLGHWTEVLRLINEEKIRGTVRQLTEEEKAEYGIE
jgi:hypothetical protein